MVGESSSRAKRRRLSNEAMEVDEVPEAVEGVGEIDTGQLSDGEEEQEGGMRFGDIYIAPPPAPAALTLDSSGPRLIITHITNNNFKSYAGVQVLGPFHKNFTSIIGPNGSGKSNVIDSMMFVFGYRASRIRSKKVSNMIHNSALHPNCSSASVDVHFCQIIDGEGDSFTVVPNSEFVISRTVFKDGRSFYKLNSRTVHFKEIAKLLNFHGIDLKHNRFLILQGEVEQIAMMKPKGPNEHETGMLEYLEEIIGTKRYNIPIQRLIDRELELGEIRKDKVIRVRTAQTALNLCMDPCAAAVDLLNKTNAAVRVRNIVLQKYIHESKKVVEKEEGHLGELKETLAKLDEKLEKVRDEMKQKQAVLDADQQKHNELATSKNELTKKLQVCNRKLGLITEDINMKNQKKKNLDKLLEQHKKTLIELELIPDKNSREIEECKRLLERHQNSKREVDEELETANAGVRDRTEVFRNEKDTLKEQLTELNREFAEAQKSHRFAESALTIYQSAEAKENEKLNKLKENHTRAEREMEEDRTAQRDLESSLPDQERELEGLKSQFQNLKSEETTLAAQVTTLKKQLAESTQALTANRSRNRVLEYLMREKSNGNLPGVFGRLGDLGAIDPKYDVAISTGCNALDNIVVDTVETAQTAIQYLKNNNVGQATFIALDKQQHLRQYFETGNYPEGAPRLFDLVRVSDGRVRAAFYFALRDTLVAAELEQASRLAYGPRRYRVVSLKGDVIELAGTMTGGGRTTKRGCMGSRVQQRTDHDPADIEEAGRRLAEMEGRLLELRTQAAQVDRDVNLLTRTVRDGRKTLAIVAGKMPSYEHNLAALKDQIRVQEQKASSARVDPARTAQLQENVARAAENLQAAVARKSEVEAKIKEADKQISALLAGKPTELKKTSDDLAKKITKINTRIAQLGVAIKTSVKDATKCKNMINSIEADLRGTTASLEDFKQQKKALTTEAAELDTKIKEVEELIEEGSSDFSAIKEEMKKLEQKEFKRSGERLAAFVAVQKKEKSLEEYRAREPAFRRELAALAFEHPQYEEVPNYVEPGPLEEFTPEQLETENLDDLRSQYEALKARIGGRVPNMLDIQTYKTKEQTFMQRTQDLDAVTKEKLETREFRSSVVKKRLHEFNGGFHIITNKLKEMYQTITLGGDAELELVDCMDPFTEGVTFSVRPPNKSWKNISNLSGGEKTLSSLALVFALHYYKPTPLYVMDEIDAALDFKNVSIVASYIKTRTKNAQFIIISLRYNMFEVCNRLVGIYKTDDCTKSVTVENVLPEEEEEPAPVAEEMLDID